MTIKLEPQEEYDEKYKNHGFYTLPYEEKPINLEKREKYYFEGKITQTER